MSQAALALAGIVALAACGSEPPWTSEPPETPPPTHARLQGVVLDGYRAGSRDLQLRARSAEVDWTGGEVVLEEVRIELPWESGGPVQVRAERGRVDLKTREFVLEGQVVASTSDGERFETRALRYEPEREMLVSDDPVRVSGKRLDVEGAGMEIHVPARRVKLLGPVRAATEPG